MTWIVFDGQVIKGGGTDMYACCAGHIDIPDMGKDKPGFYRFRIPFLTASFNSYSCKITSMDGGYIKTTPDGCYLRVSNVIKMEIDRHLKPGIFWVRCEYRWYGFEISEECIFIITHLNKMKEYFLLRELMHKDGNPSWLYIIDQKGYKRSIVYSDVAKFILDGKKGKFKGSICFSLCMYDNYRYMGGGRWGNGWRVVSEEIMLKSLEESLERFRKIGEDYQQGKQWIQENINKRERIDVREGSDET